MIIEWSRQTSGVKVLGRMITQLELLGHESLAREAHHLPQVRRWSAEVVFLVSLVFKQLVINNELEYLRFDVVGMGE